MTILWHMPALRDHCDGLSQRALALAAGLTARGHAVTFCAPADKIDVDPNSKIDKIQYSDFGIGFPAIQPAPFDLAEYGELEKTAPPACRSAGTPAETAYHTALHHGAYLPTILALPPVTARRPLHWSLQARARLRAALDQVAQIEASHDLFISSQAEAVIAYRRLYLRRPAVFVCGSSTLNFDVFDAERRADQRPHARAAYVLDRALKHRNERRAFAAADLCVFDSRHTRQRIIDRYRISPSKCHTVYGGIDPVVFSPPEPDIRRAARSALNLQPDDCLILAAGRLAPGKGLDLLLDAFARIHPGPRLILVGDGPDQPNLAAQVNKLGLTLRVQFAGPLRDVRPFLHAADIFAFPSICESFGAALVEAMAVGLPCVALRPDGRRVCNANLEILTDCETGLLSQPTAADLSRALDLLIADVPLRRRLGSAAAQFVREQFTWQRGGVRLADLIEPLFGSTAEKSQSIPVPLRTLPPSTTDTAGAPAAPTPRGPSEDRSPCVSLSTSVS